MSDARHLHPSSYSSLGSSRRSGGDDHHDDQHDDDLDQALGAAGIRSVVSGRFTRSSSVAERARSGPRVRAAPPAA